ncbi:hypothetical protein AO385_1297 [Moraxella catarrhalis]|uniref:Uncharacterized protein n=1 Tax=Moraxella catarrhalis TaxID=480 RepID=A0A198UL02_MORCA|nr:hypothetical protein AO384_0751 [Moraxella catarrhalis]OAU99480.1 hypothetical protein AO383_0178 [Moraxella catarrhalis]OAU99874.1 hypothetical protein AO385_1297 [Moraxella catarrhalis]
MVDENGQRLILSKIVADGVESMGFYVKISKILLMAIS